MNVDLAQARLNRKRTATILRRDIRAVSKDLALQTKNLLKPKSDVWSIANQIAITAFALAGLQKMLNAIVNRGDEVKILKRAQGAKPVPEKKILTCGACQHVVHSGDACQAQVTWNAGFGLVIEPCGCQK